MGNQGDTGLRITSLPAFDSHVDAQAQQHPHGAPASSILSSSASQHIESWETGLKSSSPPLAPTPKHSKGNPHNGLGRITSISLFLVTIYSTLLSGVWLAVAIRKPSWDNFIHSTASTPTNASTLAAALAKTIELSFLTSFIAMLGQYLTCKASNGNTSGISLAEVQLKVLLVQPGMLVTRWKSYSRSILSILGIMSLAACFSAMLYTTASDALGKRSNCFTKTVSGGHLLICITVSPKLGTLTEVRTIQGEVQTTPGNRDYIKKDCPEEDKDQCLDVEQDAQAYELYSLSCLFHADRC